MSANSVKELFWVFLPKILCSSKWTVVVSPASSVKGVACEISEPSESQNQCCTTQLEDFIHVKLCRLTKNGPQKQSKSFLGGGGGMPPDSPSCSVLTYTLQTDHTKPDSYGLVVCPGYEANSYCMHLPSSCHLVHSALRWTQCPCNLVNTLPLTQLSIISTDLPTAVLIQHYDIITHWDTPKMIYQLNFRILQLCTKELILVP